MQQLLPNGNQLSSGNNAGDAHGALPCGNVSSVALPSFGENLETQMRTHGLNQPALAKRVNVKTSTVNRWLKGRVPGGLDLLALARVLKIDPYVLVGSSFVEPQPVEESPRVGRPPKARGLSLVTAEVALAAADERAPTGDDVPPSEPRPPQLPAHKKQN